jgi:hypothetical protein
MNDVMGTFTTFNVLLNYFSHFPEKFVVGSVIDSNLEKE